MKKLNLIKENKRLKKEKLEKKYIKKELINIDIIFIFNNSFFDFFDSFLFELFETEFKVLLVGVNTLNKISIVF